MATCCSCAGQCGWNACVGGCTTTPRRGVGDGSMCSRCNSGCAKLKDEFGAQVFACDALKLLLCNAVMIVYLASRMPLRTPLYRLSQLGKLSCARCSADLRGVQRRPAHSKAAGCVQAPLGEARARLDDLAATLRASAKRSKSRSAPVDASGLDLRDDDATVVKFDDRDLQVPSPSLLVGSDFQPSCDAGERGPAAASSGGFVPRSDLRYPVGALSQHCGCPSWWRVESFDERLETMKVFFDFRSAVVSGSLSEAEREVVKLDAALIFRVNDRSRSASPVTANAYRFYRRHAASGPRVTRAAELLLNACLVRNALSTPVRVALEAMALPYLRLGEGGDIVNLGELDAFVWNTDGDIFGTFVNPMRLRGLEQLESGLWELYSDLGNMGARALQIAEAFCRDLDVEALLLGIRAVPGFDGSGFRAKEILCDFLDNADLFVEDATELADVKAAYKKVVVLGVGPCRTCNWLFNRPFDFCEQAPKKERVDNYVPALRYAVQRLRSLYPSEYEHRTSLDILYEFCEFNKVLKAAYAGDGFPCVPARYSFECDHEFHDLFTLEEFTDLRTRMVPFRRRMKNLALARMRKRKQMG